MMLSYVQIWTKETVFPPELNEMKLSRVIIITVVAIIIMKEGISCIDMLSTDTRRLPHRARFPGQDLQEVHLEHMEVHCVCARVHCKCTQGRIHV